MEWLRDWWRRLSVSQRRALLIAGGSGFIAFFVLSYLVTRREGQVVLYRHLTPEDLAASSAELSRAGIPHETREERGILLVPEGMVAHARMVLAEAGLPRTGTFPVPGFELFDRTSLMTSDFLQRTQYLRALQGELARSIMTLTPISHVRVHLTVPEPTIFEEQRQPATASVIIALKPGRLLSPSQVKAIVFLVARSVEGLRPENIVIVDTKGQLLWSGEEGDFLGLETAGAYLRLRWQVERALKQRLQRLLDETLGVGKAVAQVSVELETEKRESQSESFLPQNGQGQGVAVRERIVTESYQAKGQSPAQGVAGTTSNLQLLPPPSPPLLLGGNYTKQIQEREYRLSRKVERMEKVPGAIKRLSVSVLVKKDLSEKERGALEKAIASAVGIDPRRGDTVTLVAFRPREVVKPKKRPLVKGDAPAVPFWSWFAVPLLSGLLLLSLLVAWRRRRAASPPPPQPELPRPEVAPKRGELIESVRKIAREEPEKVAELVRAWLTQDGGGEGDGSHP